MKQPYATLHTIVVMYKNTLERRRCTPTQNLWPMSTNILEARNCRSRWWSCELKQEYMSLTFNFAWLCPTLYGQNDKKLALVDPHTMTSCFIPTIQTHSQLNHVALAALFFRCRLSCQLLCESPTCVPFVCRCTVDVVTSWTLQSLSHPVKCLLIVGRAGLWKCLPDSPPITYTVCACSSMHRPHSQSQQ